MDFDEDLSRDKVRKMHDSRHRRHSQSKPHRRFSFRRIRRWLKKNPNKAIAIVLAVIIVYVTYLFIAYSLDHPRKRIIIFNKEVSSKNFRDGKTFKMC